MIPAAIALEMSECDVVKRAGIAEKVEIGTNERRERTATLTYIKGQRPGIYHFTAGAWQSMELGARAAARRSPRRSRPSPPSARRSRTRSRFNKPGTRACCTGHAPETKALQRWRLPDGALDEHNPLANGMEWQWLKPSFVACMSTTR